jgi:hypothetical protein
MAALRSWDIKYLSDDGSGTLKSMCVRLRVSVRVCARVRVCECMHASVQTIVSLSLLSVSLSFSLPLSHS